MDEIKNMLNLLDEFYAQQMILQQDKEKVLEAILTPEIRSKLADVDSEFAEKAAAISENIDKLETAIKAAVKECGASVKGSFLQAVWSKPRVTWDTTKLEGFAAAHPEILPFRKVGEASVSIRKV